MPLVHGDFAIRSVEEQADLEHPKTALPTSIARAWSPFKKRTM